jgi:hypothetical protein
LVGLIINRRDIFICPSEQVGRKEEFLSINDMTDNYISFQGTSDELDTFLSEFFPQDQIKLVHTMIPLLSSSLKESEMLEKTKVVESTDGSMLNLIINEQYHLNMRKTTLALFALVMDIACTKGFTTFIFETLGISSHKLRKLNYDERQIVLLINAEKILIDEAKDEYEINDERNYGYSSDEIRAIIDKLVEDDVVIRKGRSLRIAY